MGNTYDIVADGDLCYPEMIMCDGYSTAQDSQLDKNKLSLESSNAIIK